MYVGGWCGGGDGIRPTFLEREREMYSQGIPVHEEYFRILSNRTKEQDDDNDQIIKQR